MTLVSQIAPPLFNSTAALSNPLALVTMSPTSRAADQSVGHRDHSDQHISEDSGDRRTLDQSDPGRR